MAFLGGRTALRALCAFALIAVATCGHGAEPPKPAKAPNTQGTPKATAEAGITVDQTIQALKDEAAQFNRDAQLAEDEFLYPSNSRLTVFVSNRVPGLMMTGLTVTIDDAKPVAITYDDDASRALIVKGALQQVLETNVARGAHRLRAQFTARMFDDKEGADPITGTFESLFDKTLDPSEIELVVTRTRKRTASMEMKEWRAAE